MGWREVNIYGVDETDNIVVEYLTQLRAFCSHYGCDPDMLDPSESAGGATMSFTLDANSGWLDDFTPFFIETAEQIRLDTDPNHGDLLRIRETIESQLTDQLVDLDSLADGRITAGRGARELGQRFGGEGSIEDLGTELRVHHSRLSAEVNEFGAATGPTAWKQRIELDRVIFLDAIAIISTARRIHRVASDLAKRLPGEHLTKSLATFDAHTDGLVALRNIAEHHDEYVIGQGRFDSAEAQPGQVFSWNVAKDDVQVEARGHSVGALEVVRRLESLIRCVDSASDYHAIRSQIEGLLDPDFMRKADNGSHVIVDRSLEDDEQRTFREMMQRSRRQQRPPAAPSPPCRECSEAV